MSDYDEYLKQLAVKREPALKIARELLGKADYNGAAAAVRKVDDSIYGAVALAKLMEEHLRQLVAKNFDKAFLKTAFDQTLLACYRAQPDPHTAIEAENCARWSAEDRARLVGILGYDPG